MKGGFHMIVMVSEKKDKVYTLTHLIPEMIKKENVSFDFAIDYFMKGLEADRYRIFPPNTETHKIIKWIVEGDKP
jgi:hypothetical protein